MGNLIRRFPVQIALGAMLVYGFTLSHGVTVNSLALTAKIAGWDWLPMAGHPLLWLLTLPIRWLPAGWAPLGLNLFSAACAAVSLGMLARSVELLPWFRPLAALEGWSARLPLLLAVVVCGLEFNFWQEAAAATGETLGVLLLATTLWLVLEYQIAKDSRWLKAAAFVWGAGMAESWVMQITLPLFVGSLVWLRRRRFFKLQFILPMAGLGLAGFAIYALLPLANGLLPGSPWNLQQAWMQSLRETKIFLLLIYDEFWLWHRMVGLAALLFFLLPLLGLLSRFGNADTKNKSKLDRAQIWSFRGVGAGLLLFSAWLAFDPTFGPRQLLATQVHLALPLLTFDYLNALGVGFLAGNLLLIFQPPVKIRRHRKIRRQLAAWLRQVVAPGLTALLIAVVLGLISYNLPAITLANRQPLDQFGKVQLADLPPGGGIVLSDFPQKLEVFQAAQARFRGTQRWLPVDLSALPKPEYRARLQRLGLGDWLTTMDEHELNSDEVLLVMDRLAQTNRIFHIHPAFGRLFEIFYPQPAGLVYELQVYSTNTVAIDPPPLTAQTIARNEKIWDDLAPEIESLPKLGSPVESSLLKRVRRNLYLETVVPGQIGLLKEWYSLALNDWGVQLQRNGLLPSAQRRFNQALRLNTNNWIARLNLYCNTNLQSGTNKMSLAGAGTLESQLGSAQQRALSMSYLGPMDEPDGCYILGKDYQQNGWLRLAILQFGRARALAPKVLAPEFALANLFGRCGLTNQAMTTLNHLRGEIKTLPDHAGFEVQLALIEASVWLSQSNLSRAVSVLQKAVQQHPDDPDTLKQISQEYFALGDSTDAEQLVTRLLELEPDNIPALLIQTSFFLQTRRADLAIPVLNHVLSLTNSLSVKLVRAVAYVEIQNYAAAKADYQELELSLPNGFQADYGLAQIAELQHDTNAAIHYLKLCLTNGPPDTAQSRKVRERLDALQSSRPGR